MNYYLFSYAWKNIWRHKGRSFFIILSVTLAVAVSIWVMALFKGTNHQIEEAVVYTNTGHYQIQETNFSYSTNSNFPIKWSDEIENILRENQVFGFSPELILDANISTPEGSTSLVIIGIVPHFHKKLMPVAQHMKEGKYFVDEYSEGAIIGEQLAIDFNYKIGDQIVINYQDFEGSIRSELVEIKGIHSFNAKVFQRKFVYLSQKTWQELYFNEYTEVLFNRMPILSVDNKIKSKLLSAITNIKIKSWKEINPEMAVVLDFHDGMVRFFFLIIAVTILMTIITPVRILWQERVKEFQMMHTLGINFNHFWKIGFFELLLMIFLTSVFSLIFISAIIYYQGQHGIDFNFLNAGVPIERGGIRLPRFIYPLLSFDQIYITFCMVISVIGISYGWSISRTLKKLKENL